MYLYIYIIILDKYKMILEALSNNVGVVWLSVYCITDLS